MYQNPSPYYAGKVIYAVKKEKQLAA